MLNVCLLNKCMHIPSFGLPQISKVPPLFIWHRGWRESPELLSLVEGFLSSAELVKFLKPCREEEQLALRSSSPHPWSSCIPTWWLLWWVNLHISSLLQIYYKLYLLGGRGKKKSLHCGSPWEEENTAHSPRTVVLENLLEGWLQRQAGERHTASVRACEEARLAARSKSAAKLPKGRAERTFPKGLSGTFLFQHTTESCWTRTWYRKERLPCKDIVEIRKFVFTCDLVCLIQKMCLVFYFRNSILFLCSAKHNSGN